MQKFIRISAIVAVALNALALTLLLFSIPCQSFLAETLFHYPDNIIEMLPIFPTLPVINLLLGIGCTLPLVFICGKKNGGIVGEIILFACLMLVLPIVSMITTPLYTLLLSNLNSAQYLAANSIVNTLANYCTIPANWGHAVAYTACGMSIVYKLMTKKAQQAEIAAAQSE